MLRWRQMTSSRISAGRRLASIAPATVSMVAGARSCPRSTSSTSSSTTASASLTSPSSPSSVRTFPRRWIPHWSRPSSSRRTASSDPASSAAIVLSSVSCLRAKRYLRESRADRFAHPLAVRATVDLCHRHPHDLAHVAEARGAGLLDRRVDQARELLVGELRRQVALDQLRLPLLRVGATLASALAERRRGLESPLTLAPQHRQLVVPAPLRVLLEGVRDEAQRAHPLALAGLHRGPGVGLDLFQDAHGQIVAAALARSIELDVLHLGQRHLQEARPQLAE